VSDIFSILPHGVAVEASICIGWDLLGWSQSTTTGGTLREEVDLKPFVSGNNGSLAETDPEMHTMYTKNETQMKK